MKVCIYGAGAVGGHIAGRLARARVDLSVVARGEHLAALQTAGLRVETPEGILLAHPTASADPQQLGAQDVVVVAVKAPTLQQLAANIAPLLNPRTGVLFVMNGIPWWYFHAHGGPFDDRRLPQIDPQGVVWEAVGPTRAAGAVIHTSCTVTAPGVIRVANPRNRLVLGRPDGHDDPLLASLAAELRTGGLEVEITSRIRDAIWEKLLMNLVGGSLGILTASAMGDALSTPAVALAAHEMAREGAAIAKSLGCDAGDPLPGLARLKTSAHKQSILQDLERGRSMEVDALFTVPLELARMAGVPTPTLDLIVGLAVRRARAARLYGE